MSGTTTRRNYPYGVLGDNITDLLSIAVLAQAIDDDLYAAVTGAFAAHAVLAYRSSGDGDSSNISDSTYSAIGYPSELIDTDGYHGSPNTELIVPTGLNGYYICGATARFAGAATGSRREVALDVNGSGNYFAKGISQVANSGQAAVNCVGFMHLADGDYVKANLFQDSGGGLAIKQEGYTPNLWMARLPFFA